ncbi:MAG: phosphoenolpyruvate synthase [Chloroflexi bacterium]|nr:phosphoenolpyruvate synthase [Chloroflexota bacterium]
MSEGVVDIRQMPKRELTEIQKRQASLLWFSEVDAGDLSLAGGKGANLGEMTRRGAPVPPGFVVSVVSYQKFLTDNGLDGKLSEILGGVDVYHSSNLVEVASQAQQAILSAPMPTDLAAEITEAYTELGEGPVAVRSSATAEDLPDASFAGQQRTYLNVEGIEQVLETVKGCWASLFEARAIFYRAEQNFNQLGVGIAVPVQRMVQSEISGVMFTAEPNRSDRSKVLIEAVYGLGESVVSGAVTPDSYLIQKDGLEILEKRLVPQSRMLTRNPDAVGADDLNHEVDVPGEMSRTYKLTDTLIAEIAQHGLNLEEAYNHPQDIEWAMEGNSFYITQTRPITTLSSVGESEGLDVDESAYPMLLQGTPASPGSATGTVVVLPKIDETSLDQLERVKEGDVLVTEMTTPDYVPAMKRAVAIITNHGGRTAHAAIISRELSIPCTVGTGEATTTLTDGQIVTVDGSTGRVYEGAVPGAGQEISKDDAAASLRTKTNVYVNLAEPDLADVIAARNVDGVGLLRAEFIVARIGEHPRLMIEEGRGEEYTQKVVDGLMKFAAAFDPRPVIYRTTDFKTNEYRNLRGGDRYEPEEENPMIGYRGAGRYVKEPDIFALEIEAVRRVRAKHPNLHVMIPFVRTVDELVHTKSLLEQYGLRRGDNGFKLWMMAEVPSNVFLLEEFINVGIDGVSIGSNDLTQLVLGVDRDSAILADDFDERNEAVMRALETIVTTAARLGITCGICGQAPSFFPDLTAKLVEWGITSVSVSPDVINHTRRIVHEVETAQAADAAKG